MSVDPAPESSNTDSENESSNKEMWDGDQPQPIALNLTEEEVIDEEFDDDDFDEEFDDDFEEEVEGEYDLEDDQYGEEFNEEFGHLTPDESDDDEEMENIEG